MTDKQKSLSVNLTMCEWETIRTIFQIYSESYGIFNPPQNETELEKYKNAEDDSVEWSDVYEYGMRGMWSINKKIDNKKKADVRSLIKLKNDISSPYIKEINELKLHNENLKKQLDKQHEELNDIKDKLKEILK